MSASNSVGLALRIEVDPYGKRPCMPLWVKKKLPCAACSCSQYSMTLLYGQEFSAAYTIQRQCQHQQRLVRKFTTVSGICLHGDNDGNRRRRAATLHLTRVPYRDRERERDSALFAPHHQVNNVHAYRTRAGLAIAGAAPTSQLPIACAGHPRGAIPD